MANVKVKGKDYDMGDKIQFNEALIEVLKDIAHKLGNTNNG